MLHPLISHSDLVKAIVELLKQNNRVIVPNFGAFISSQGSSNKILFNNFLSFNDGLLIGFLCQEKNMPKNDVLIEVNNFVESIRNNMENRGEFSLPGLGKFSKDNHNILRFEQDEELKIEHVAPMSQQEAPKDEAKDLLDIDPVAAAHDETVTLPDETPVAPAATNPGLLTFDDEPVVAPPVIEPEPVKTATEVPPAKPEPVAAEQKKRPLKETLKKEPVREVAQPEKKRRTPIVIFFAIILLGALAWLYYSGNHLTVYNYVAKAFTSKEQAAPVKIVVTPVPVAPQPQVQAEPQPQTTAPATSNLRYHIIVATMRNETDADQRVTKLKEKGFDNATVLNRNGKFLVSIDAGNDWVQTELRQEEIVNKYKIESYLISIK